MAGTTMLLHGAYKFIHTFGYKDFQGNVPFFDGVNELYNLEEDPEELNNLFQKEPTVASDMYNQLLGKLIDVDSPYLESGGNSGRVFLDTGVLVRYSLNHSTHKYSPRLRNRSSTVCGSSTTAVGGRQMGRGSQIRPHR